MASVGKHIRRLRTAKGLTQEQLAEKLFVTRQTVSAWETGKAQPDLETLERIAAALETEVTEVIYGTPQVSNLRQVKRRWAMIGGGLTSCDRHLFSAGEFRCNWHLEVTACGISSGIRITESPQRCCQALTASNWICATCPPT